MTENWRQGASLFQGRRAVGGHIELSHDALDFTPHVIDRKTGGRTVSIRLEADTE